jgi:hypothetical protein
LRIGSEVGGAVASWRTVVQASAILALGATGAEVALCCAFIAAEKSRRAQTLANRFDDLVNVCKLSLILKRISVTATS